MNKIPVLIAAPTTRLNVWGPVLSSDERLHVISVAMSPDDLQNKLVYKPQVIILDGAIFPGPEPLRRFLMSLNSNKVFLVLPTGATLEQQQSFAELPVVQEVHIGDFPELHRLADRIMAAIATRTTQGWGEEGYTPPGSALVVGFRVVVFWNHKGGTGKSTLAMAVAQEAAARGVPTMLVGLDTPDTNPLVLGLKPEPNIATWIANPTIEGLQRSLQIVKQNGLAVLGGFPDVLTEARFASLNMDHPASLNALVRTASRAGYVLVVLDTPNTDLAAQAIAAATHLVLVSRPSLADILSTVEAYRTVTERVSGEHRLPTSHILVALNMVGGRIAPKEWHRAATEMLRDVSGAAFPPLAATIPFLPAVAAAQDRRQSPLSVGEFRKAIQGLVNALVPPMPAVATVPNTAQEYRMGPVRVKVRT